MGRQYQVELRNIGSRCGLEIDADLDKVGYGHVMRTTSQPDVQLLDSGHVRFGEDQATDAKLRDAGGEDVLLQVWDCFVVDVLDRDQRRQVLSGDDVNILLPKFELVDT